MEASKAFGLVIRKLRVAKGLTQENLGFDSGLTRAYISSIELDQKLPSITAIKKVIFSSLVTHTFIKNISL